MPPPRQAEQSVNHKLEIITTAVLWGGSAALVMWLLTWPLRRRSQTGVLVSVALVSTAASIATVIGNTRAMFLSMQDEYATVSIALTAGLVAAVAGVVSARRFAHDKRAVHEAVDALREGRVPVDDGRRMSGELQTLRRELSETARTLAESREREQALEAARRELVAWVSHDLRTPLAGMRAMAEALEDGVAPSPERYHKQIRIEVDRLSSMVDDLFEISRLQSGAPRTRSDRVMLADLVSDCVAALEPVASRKGVRLTGRASAPANVQGNSAELNRALTNLLVNGIRHTDTDGAIEISLDVIEESGARQALVAVRDQCGGISEADIERVFEVGYRGESARTPQPELGAGAGLGLAITQGIVAAHGGTVTVQNTTDGCEFAIRLPIAD
jgi:signal transduction histidine kinase